VPGPEFDGGEAASALRDSKTGPVPSTRSRRLQVFCANNHTRRSRANRRWQVCGCQLVLKVTENDSRYCKTFGITTTTSTCFLSTSEATAAT
jgi:hypothetical protein